MVRSYSICSNTTKLAIIIVIVFTLKIFSMHSWFSSSNINDCAKVPMLTTSLLPKNISEKEFLEAGFDHSQNLDIDNEAVVNDNITDEMKNIIDKLKLQIENETRGYKLPSFRKLEDLIPGMGGTPMRSIVITTWRSGSTFIGGVLNSHPGTFHFSEPLTDYRTVQVRGEPLAGPAVRALHSLLTCNYHVLERYLERSKGYTWLFTHNTRLWQHCIEHKEFCWLPQFLKPVCRLFPFQSMKVVHIRLRLVEALLADSEMNIRVLLLVRDPRGIMESRSTLSWCKAHEDCSNPTHVCADLVDDYSAAMRFKTIFPDKFRVVRYEDMSLRPNEVIPDIFKFFGLQYHPEVQKFVQSHTTKNSNSKYSTFRNSTDTALMWRRRSKHAKVQELQSTCKVALAAWGYLPAHNASHQLVFNPLVEPFSI